MEIFEKLVQLASCRKCGGLRMHQEGCEDDDFYNYDFATYLKAMRLVADDPKDQYVADQMTKLLRFYMGTGKHDH